MRTIRWLAKVLAIRFHVGSEYVGYSKWTSKSIGCTYVSLTYLSDGGLLVKLFRRKASLDERIDLAAPPKAYNIKLNIPKKSKIFIDQTVRERDNANQINQVRRWTSSLPQ